MKKIIYIVGLILATAGMTSCSDWLHSPSEDKFDSGMVFENADRVEMVILGAYKNTFNRELYYQLGMGTDECISTEGETNSKNQIANYLYTTSNAPTSTYTAMYSGIETVNICIKALKEMKGGSDAEQQKINMLLGEAYAIRGMNYLNLVRFFGDVPYTTIPVIDAGTFASSRVSRDEIMDGSIADLQKAVELLPWYSEGRITTPERFSKNAAYGILARAALYAAGFSLRWDLNTVPYNAATVKLAQRSDAARIKELYGIAVDACKQVIEKGDNDLVDGKKGYETVFRTLVNGLYSKESLLEIGQYGAEVNSYSIGYTNGIYSHTNSKFKKSQPAMVAIATYYFDFEEGDTRRDVSIANYGIDSKTQMQMNAYASNTIGKFRIDWKREEGTAINKRDINWPMLRYSDVLLMYAEALNEYNNAPTAEAISAFEKVRTRAFGGDKGKIGKTPASYADFRNAIINERKLELGFEGWRRTDLVRWGILYEALTQTKQNIKDMANHTGKYTDIDRFRAYKKETIVSFENPTVAVSFKSYKTEPSDTEKDQLKKDGYTLLDMYSNISLNFPNKMGANEKWVTNLFRGLEKNKVELLPLNTTSILDVNPGLTGQQHPMY